MPRDAVNPAIGTLRWPVTIAYREQVPAITGGLTETYANPINVRADIQPIDPLTYYAGAQVDTPATHMIRVRFLDWLDTTHVVFRDMHRPDGTIRREIFRIRRIKEIDGRQRFLELEAELEKRE